ncbi:MAG TPA: FAD-binding protein, partial [Kribbella sp.]
MADLTNWAGNITFSTGLERPESILDLQELVSRSDKVRVLGTGHSFNRIADTTGTLVSVADLPRMTELREGSVTISAGLRYGEVTAALQAQGFALHNLG